MSGIPADQSASKRRRLLSLLLEQEGLAIAEPTGIERASRSAGLPLSFAQQRLWVLDRLIPRRSLYNAPLAFRLRGPLDLSALHRAFTGVVARHEALRTAFPARSGAPVQMISRPGPTGLRVISLAATRAGEAEAEAERLALAEADAPFDLEHGPLLRVTLIKLADHDHVLLISLHHIVTDGWSLGVMFGELGTLYEAACDGLPPVRLPDLTVQYADYAAWQRRRMSGERLRRELDYWTGRLAGAPRMVTFPTERPRCATPRFDGAEHDFTIPSLGTLKTLAADQDATVYMVLLAAFKVLLARYSGETDVVVGTPVAGRGRLELEPLIGFFVNSIVLRTDLRDDPPFTEIVRRVRRTALDAYDHQELPFEKLVDEVQPTRQLSVHPLFQVSFQLFQPRQDLGPRYGGSLTLPGLSVEPYPTGTRTSKFDLSVTLSEHPGHLSGLIEYSTELYDADAIDRITGNFRTLIDGIVACPEQRMSELPMLTRREHLRVIERWNDTARPVAEGRCLHELVEAQAKRTPEAVALIFESRPLTYRRLDARANALAHRLRALGVGPESVVGVCMERSVEAVLGLLAVLKAGAAFLPLDPDQPAERLAYMLTNTRASVLLTHGQLIDAPWPAPGIQRCDAGYDWSRDHPTTAPVTGVEPGNPAYAIYTSGSTGRPKCVITPHAGVVNLVQWMQGEYLLTAADRVLLKAPFGFDVSIWEIFWTLSAGAAVVIACSGGQREPKYLARLITGEQVTVVHFVPSMLRAFVAEPAARDCASLRMVICGGEAITPDLLARLHETLDVDLHNQYGPTEASVQTAYWPLQRGDTRIVLGRGTWNTRLYVLDAHQMPAPQGATGELHIAGVQLARGYLNQPGLTAERFLPDPYGRPGTRMYRTGDLVRWLPNGTLDFLGRTDHQVKVRGYRVEPGEIECQLKAHPAVRNAAVIARQGLSGERGLIGYIVPREDRDAGPLATALRDHLSGRLPAYMVPTSLVVLDTLPLNSNGKVDLAALPAPGEAPDRPELVPPRTRAERILGEVWRSVLRLEQVGTGDNFFNLGGDSIRAIEVASASEAAGLLVTPSQLFQHQTLGELAAAAIDAADGATGRAAEAEQGEVTGPVCLTPIQRSYLAAGDPERDYLAQYAALVVTADLDPDVIEAALDHLIRHHDLLRATYECRADGCAQVISPHRPGQRLGRATVDGPDLDAVLDAQAARLGAELSPAEGRLLRALLIDRRGARPVLLIVVHHLCVDAVSWRILIEDLNAACRQLAAGEPEPRLPAKTTSFRTWASRLRDLAQSPDLADEAERWRSLLPARRPSAPARRMTLGGDLRRADRALSREATRALLEEVPDAYRTRTRDVLLTALAMAAHRTTGSLSLLVDVEGHGREPLFADINLTRTVGWFTSIFPVHVELADPADVEGCLMAVKETLRAVPRNGIGFGLLQSPGDEAPAADILFNYLGRTDLSGPGEPLLRPVPEPVRATCAPSRPRSHPVEVVAQITDGRLAVRCLSGPCGPHRVEALADHFIAALEEITAMAGRPDGGARTASDFPLSGLSTADLRRLFGSGRGVEDVYPLSAVQEGILFHTLAAHGTDMYLIQATWELGDIDGQAMAEAWCEVARRNTILRTRLVWDVVDRPLQVVEREASLPVTLLDWSDRRPAEREAALEDLLEQGRQRGIDLRRAPLARVTLIKAGPAAWRVALEFHHLLLDGWSIVALLADVLAVYDAMVTGAELRLPARPPFRDYIAWQETRARGGEREFWRDYLAGFTAPTPLPAEPGLPDRGHARHDVQLPDGLASALDRFTRRVRVTKSTVFQAAWGMLLGQYSGTDDVVFGAAVSGRSGLPEVEEMIGILINMLPVRVRIAADAPVAAWLGTLQSDRARIPSEHTSLTDIARSSEVPRRMPLFDSALVFENYPVPEPVRTALGGLSAKVLRVEQTANYPLILEVKAGPPLEAALLYDRSRFRPAGIAEIARRLMTLLTEITAAPEAPVSGLFSRTGPRGPISR